MEVCLIIPEDIAHGRFLKFDRAENFEYFHLDVYLDGPSLKILKFSQLTDLSMQGFMEGSVNWNDLTLNNPRVKSLTLFNYTDLSHEDLKIITTNWNLSQLHILQCNEDLDELSLQMIFENCSNLSMLSLNLYGVKDDYADIFKEFAMQLENMDIEIEYDNY